MHNLLSSIITDIVIQDVPNPMEPAYVFEHGEDIMVAITTKVWVDSEYKELNSEGRTFRISGFNAEERFIALRRVPEVFTRTYGEEQYIKDSIEAKDSMEALVYN